MSVLTLPALSDGAGKKKGDAKSPVKITSKRLQANTAKRWIKFEGDVVIEEEYMLCANELMLSYEENKDIKEISAKGNVRILHGTKRAKGHKAVYDKKNRAIIITGKAVVSQCSDRVSGEKITLYLDKDSVIVDGGKKGRVRVVIMPDKECTKGDESKEFQCKRPR